MLRQEMTPTAQPDLAPELQAALHASLSQYLGIQEQIALLEALADEEKQRLNALLEEAGVDKLTHPLGTVSIVRGVTNTLDKARLKAQGVSEAMIAAATVTKPKKPYVLIRKAGEKDDAAE